MFLRMILALLAVGCIALAVVSAVQLRSYAQQHEQGYHKLVEGLPQDEPQPPMPEPDYAAERRRLREKGMFWHAVPWAVWLIAGGALLLIVIVWSFISRKRTRPTRLEAVINLSNRRQKKSRQSPAPQDDPSHGSQESS